MASVDTDKTGEIEFDEFRTLMAHSMTQEGPGSSTIAQGTDLPFEEVGVPAVQPKATVTALLDSPLPSAQKPCNLPQH